MSAMAGTLEAGRAYTSLETELAARLERAERGIAEARATMAAMVAAAGGELRVPDDLLANPPRRMIARHDGGHHQTVFTVD